MPNIRQVPRQFSGHQENGVDTNVVAVAGVARSKAFGGKGNTPQPILIKRRGSAFRTATRFYFNESNDLAAASDEIDLSARCACAPSEDAPAVQPKPPCGECLGFASLPFCNLAAVQRLSSSARE